LQCWSGEARNGERNSETEVVGDPNAGDPSDADPSRIGERIAVSRIAADDVDTTARDGEAIGA
jgi:hypothetical protein